VQWTEVRAVSFDAGGTLIATPDGPATALLGEAVGVDLPAMRAFLAVSAKRSRTSCAALAREIATGFGALGAAERLEALLEALRREALAPTAYADAAPVLAQLRRRGYVVVVLTNVVGAIAPPAGAATYGRVDAVFSSCDIGAVKPERAAFAAVERAIGLAGEELLHVGDSAGADVAGAHAAGWHALHLDRPASVPGPSTIRSLTDLLPMLPARRVA
jgi:HAD superfamily hydrolase (TIGR01509 family)